MNPYVIIALIIVWSLSMFGVGKWQYSVGQEHERVEWQTKENKQLSDANAKIIALNAAARTREQEHAAQVNAISTQFAKDRNELIARGKRDADAARAGTLSLRIPSNCPDASGGRPAEAGAGAAGSPATATTELPRQVTEDLLDLANDADAVVIQLTSCQAILISDRQGASP